MIILKKNLKNKIIEDYKTNLIHHPYFILLKIYKLNLQLKNCKRLNLITYNKAYYSWSETIAQRKQKKTSHMQESHVVQYKEV